MAREAGLDKSTTYRIINTLKNRGYVQQDELTRKFCLGMKMFELGSVQWNTLNVVRISRSELKELSKSIKETIILTILGGNYAICVDQIESSYQLRMRFHLGKRMQLHAGASNKVILAYLFKSESKTVIEATGLPRYCLNTHTDVNSLEANLTEVRKLGYAYSEEETDMGCTELHRPYLTIMGELWAV